MNTVKTTFLLRTNRKNKAGDCPIYLRIIVNGQRRELSTQKYVPEERWKSDSQRMKGSLPFANAVNSYLDQLKRKVMEAETILLKRGEDITAGAIKDFINGESEKQTDLIEFFREHNEKMEELVGSEYSSSTLKKYQTCLKHLSSFIRKTYNQNSYLIQKVNLSFIKDYEHFLKTKKDPCCHNTALKYISHLKKVVREALDRDLISQNPFRLYKETYNDKDPVYLTHAELQALKSKEFKIERVDRVRDVFLFCCYTGLSYSDVEKVTYSDIDVDQDGENWLMVNRTKTKEPCKILLLPIPMRLIQKYKDDPETQNGNILPVISNQKTNAYLKEIAGLCAIEKKLTFHCARHTFATTVALENGVPIETVQKILGHKDSRSTEIYARVTRRKVGRDMKKLRKIMQ